MAFKRSGKLIKTTSDEANNYSITNYPSVRAHYPCRETSVLVQLEEVNRYDNYYESTTTITYGTQYAQSINKNGIAPRLSTQQFFPAIPGTNFTMVLDIFRCQGSAAGGGSATLGSLDVDSILPQAIVSGMRNGQHYTITDDAGTSLLQSPDAAKKATAGTDYVLVTFIRPIGGSCGSVLYDLNGNIVSYLGTPCSSLVTNVSGFTTFTNIYYQYGGPVVNSVVTEDKYQLIAYSFATEPSDYLTCIKWHGATAPQGIKAPYPPWKNRQ